MSEMATSGTIPPLTLGWRLKMAMGSRSREEMAQALDVSPATITRWTADKGAPPRRIYVKQWALITRTNYKWLETGKAPDPDEGLGKGDEDVRHQGLEPRTRWFGGSRLSRVRHLQLVTASSAPRHRRCAA